MRLSQVREAVREYKEEFDRQPFSFFESYPPFIKSITAIFNCKADLSFVDRDLVPAEEIALARILIRAERDDSFCRGGSFNIFNEASPFEPQWRLRGLLNWPCRELADEFVSVGDFVKMVGDFEAKGLLQEFGVTFVVNKKQVYDAISHLKIHRLDTAEHIRFCFQYLNRSPYPYLPAVAQVMVALLKFNPVLLTAEQVYAVLAAAKIHGRLYGVCQHLQNLWHLRPEARTAACLADYLARVRSVPMQLAFAIGYANPALLEDNMRRIQTITRHGEALCSAIHALRQQKQITQEDLDFLFSNASNVIIAAMSRGAIFDRTDPVIEEVFAHLQTLSAFKRHQKTPPPHFILASVASSLGLSGETIFLVDCKPQAEMEARQVFFSNHIRRSLAVSAPPQASAGSVPASEAVLAAAP